MTVFGASTPWLGCLAISLRRLAVHLQRRLEVLLSEAKNLSLVVTRASWGSKLWLLRLRVGDWAIFHVLAKRETVLLLRRCYLSSDLQLLRLLCELLMLQLQLDRALCLFYIHLAPCVAPDSCRTIWLFEEYRCLINFLGLVFKPSVDAHFSLNIIVFSKEWAKSRQVFAHVLYNCLWFNLGVLRGEHMQVLRSFGAKLSSVSALVDFFNCRPNNWLRSLLTHHSSWRDMMNVSIWLSIRLKHIAWIHMTSEVVLGVVVFHI